MNENVDIEMLELDEFEFNSFSVFFDPKEDFWYLETYEDDDSLQRVIIENEEGYTYSTNKEIFEGLGFLLEDFTRIKEFKKGKNT